jgi:NADP-dependent 3-hydroxy acid dehydrogenase YdfG
VDRLADGNQVVRRSMRNTMGTEQKVVVVTGASQGFGAALVNAYRDRNYRVIANSRSITFRRRRSTFISSHDVCELSCTKLHGIETLISTVYGFR